MLSPLPDRPAQVPPLRGVEIHLNGRKKIGLALQGIGRAGIHEFFPLASTESMLGARSRFINLSFLSHNADSTAPDVARRRGTLDSARRSCAQTAFVQPDCVEKTSPTFPAR